jgi:hypothetical protein
LCYEAIYILDANGWNMFFSIIKRKKEASKRNRRKTCMFVRSSLFDQERIQRGRYLIGEEKGNKFGETL